MLQRLNLNSLKEMDMAQLKGMGNSALNHFKEVEVPRLKSMGHAALNSLKEVDMTRVKRMSGSALNNIARFSRKKVALGRYSVSPLVIGGAAVALLIGGYLLLRRKARATQFAGDTAMQPQYEPVK